LLELSKGTFSAPPICEPEEDFILVFEQFKTVI
jgi:hypothetical protein